uniref:Uncharacterized protein n=1 Tax=Sinocyclocheilus rhinocerous TaxID=307959 RepID=A0A673HFG7_9TELE
MADRSELVVELKGWCHGKGLDEAHSLMVMVPEDVEIAQIEDTLHTVKCLGRVRVRGRTFSVKHNRIMALCECREQLKAENVPQEISPISGGEAWPVVIIGEAPASADEFSMKLLSLLQAEGKTLKDLRDFFPSSEPTTSTTDVLQIVGNLLEKTTKPSLDMGSYRRLRLFSGMLPTPCGKEQFDNWLEQAQLMVEESECADKEKRRRLMESLKGPALDIVKSARVTDPEISAAKCLEALENAFGTAESGEDLYFAFRIMRQQPTETTFLLSSNSQDCVENKPVTITHCQNPLDAELITLKKQVKRLQQKVSNRETEADVTVSKVEVSSKKRQPQNPSEEQFCYRCEENGYLASRRPNPENLNKVITRQIHSLKIANAKVDCSVKRSLVKAE